MFNFIQNLCWPSLIYLIISLFTLIITNSYNNLFGNIIHIIVIILITYLFDRICKTYGQTTSWYVLIILYTFPVILAMIIGSLMVIFNSNISLNLSDLPIKTLSQSFSKHFSKSLKITETLTPSKLTDKITNKITKLVSSKM